MVMSTNAIANERLLILCHDLLRAEDITVIETAAGELHAAIDAHVQRAREQVGNYIPVIVPEHEAG